SDSISGRLFNKSINLGRQEIGAHSLNIEAYDKEGNLSVFPKIIYVGGTALSFNVELSPSQPTAGASAVIAMVPDEKDVVYSKIVFLVDGKTIATNVAPSSDKSASGFTIWTVEEGKHFITIYAESTDSRAGIGETTIFVRDYNGPKFVSLKANDIELSKTDFNQVFPGPVIFRLTVHDPGGINLSVKPRLLIKEDELYNKALEITKNTFGENSEFYKNANSKLVGDKKIIAYTLLSICELKNLNGLENTQGFRLELAIEHFNKLFIPSMKSEQIKRFEMAGYGMKEDPLLFNPYAALVIANVGIAQIMGGSRYIDLVAYLNRHDQIQDVHAVITYILEKGGIAYPFIYQNPILINDEVGVTFLTKIIDENNEKFNKYFGGIDQSFYPNLITNKKNEQHNPYIVSPIEIIESYSPNYIKMKIFPQFLSHRNKYSFEVEYNVPKDRQKYPDERKKEDILSILTPTEQILVFEAPQSRLAPPPTKIPPSTTARFERLYGLPTQFEMKIGESGFYYNGVPSPSAIQKFGEEGANSLTGALANGLNVKETGDVKNAVDNIINELNKWQPKSESAKAAKDNVIKQLQNAKTPEELRAAIVAAQQQLGVDFFSSIYSYRWEGNTLSIRNWYGIEVNINMNVTKEEIEQKLGKNFITFINTLATRVGLAYSQVSGTLSEERLTGFNEKGEPIFESTGKTKTATMSELKLYLENTYNFLAFKAPAIFGGVGLVQVNVDINFDKQSLERTISDNKMDYDNWLASVSNISGSIDFPFGKGFHIRRLELGYLNPIFVTGEGKMQLTENPFGSITFGYKEKLGNITLESYVTPTYLINTEELILSSLIRALIPVGKNLGIIPTLGLSYDFRDGRLDANFGLPLQWWIFEFGPSLGIEHDKILGTNFKLFLRGKVNF
ncbi:MAG: hypothetical protein QW153_02015, partial [Candidatus Bilamarchaeaceae archaeon]